MSRVFVSRGQFRQAFLAAWAEVYVGERRKKLLVHAYREKPKRWTNIMFGQKPLLLCGKSLLARTVDELNKLDIGGELDFDRERHKVDVFGRVKEDPKGDHTGGINVVMIEVENDTKKSYEEFWKLVHSRCTLRVLITYRVPGKEEDLRSALKSMQGIYNHATDVLASDEANAYLLIVGTRKAKDAQDILWEFYGLDSQGRFTEEIE